MKRVVILGAGISGLSLGWFLKQLHKDNIHLTILEKEKRTGGWIRTREEKGFLFDEGPKSCRSKGSGIATLQMVEELGLENEVIPAAPNAVQRFLYLDGKLQPLPNGFFSFLFSPLMQGMIPALWKEWRIKPSQSEDESIYDFISRRLSSDIAERLIDPLTLGIYAGDIRQLSIQACFPKLYDWEKRAGSLLKGMLSRRASTMQEKTSFVSSMQKAPLFSFKGGMETLTRALSVKLEGSIRLGSSVTMLKVGREGLRVTTDDGTIYPADQVFCALPADTAAALLNSPNGDSKVLETGTTSASVVVVNMGWKAQVLKYQGFGHLVPTKEKENILGIVWDSSIFPQQNFSSRETRLTVMLGGIHHSHVMELSDHDILNFAVEAVSRQLGIHSPPDMMRLTRARQAIPQYMIGHLQRLKREEHSLGALFPHLTLLGSSRYGVSVNDCIAQAKSLAYGRDKNTYL